MNPDSHGIRRSGVEYRLHDKVMQIRNNYDKEVFNGDIGKIELAAIRETIARRINAGAVADQFFALFNRINANTDTAMVEQLGKELDAMLRGEDIPEALSAQLQLARNKLQEGNRVLRNWNTTFDNAMSLYDKLLERQDFYSGLQCLRELKSYAFYRVFADTNYSMSEEQMQKLRRKTELLLFPYCRTDWKTGTQAAVQSRNLGNRASRD